MLANLVKSRRPPQLRTPFKFLRQGPSCAAVGVRGFVGSPMERRMANIETGTNDLLASVEDGVATLVMNRPERRNALSGAMLTAMGTALSKFEADPDVAVIVLTGAGGAVCAGRDLKGIAEGTGGGYTEQAGADL